MKKYVFLICSVFLLLVADTTCNLADTPLTRVILSHESKNYDATNKSCGKNPNGTTKWCYTDLKPTQMTIGEIKAEFAKGSSNLNAVGRAQFIQDTFLNIVKVVGLKDSDIFNKELQDSLMERYFYKIKRPSINNYLYGNGDIEKAAYDIAREWASVGVKKGRELHKYKNKPQGYSETECGDSFYRDGSAGNKGWTCYAEIIEALKITKEMIQNNNCNTQDYNTTRPDNNSTDGNFGDYDDDIGDDVNVGTNSGGGCGGCVSLPAILKSTQNSLLNFKEQEQQTARAINTIIEAIFYAHQDLEKQNENLAKQTQKLMEEENLIQKELLYNKIRINKLQDLINTKKAEE